MESLAIVRPRTLVLVASICATFIMGQGCPSFNAPLDDGSNSSDDGNNPSVTCLSDQVAQSDGTCAECESWYCPDGEYYGSDDKCHPAPSTCPNYVAGLPESDQIAEQLATEDSAYSLQSLGDGLAARQAAMAELFPEIQELLDTGDLAGQVLAERFDGVATGDQDAALSIYAYVLAQLGYTTAQDQLSDFLRDNITGEVPDACSAVTHTLRTFLADPDLPPKDSAYYLMSEMEDTINATLGYSYYKKIVTAKAAEAKECGREFYILGADGKRIKDANGKDIKVGGTVSDPNASSGFENTALGQKKAKEITDGGGTYVTYTDPQSGTVFEGYPTKRFNCAGFAFREFIGGQRWRADPKDMLNSLGENGAGLLEEIWESSAKAGDFVFFWRGSSDTDSAHVAVVKTPSGLTGTTTVINADGYSGMFTAPLNSKYMQEYQKKKFYRWKSGSRPTLEVSTDRSQTNSCFGDDTNSDGWPETVGCAVGKCIDSEFIPAYRVYMADMYNGQLEVMEKGSENKQIPACQFEGGGLDCTVYIAVSPITEPFSSESAAVLSLCSRITDLRVLPLGVGPAAKLDGTQYYTSWEVYNILLGCPK